MSRRRRAVKRVITPDPVYHDKNVTTFINKLMLDGKKSKAESIFYKAIDIAAKKTNKKKPEKKPDSARRRQGNITQQISRF